jgi:hypothetical protein
MVPGAGLPRYPPGAERASTLSGMRATENALAAVGAFRTQSRGPLGAGIHLFPAGAEFRTGRVTGFHPEDPSLHSGANSGLGRNKTAPHV